MRNFKNKLKNWFTAAKKYITQYPLSVRINSYRYKNKETVKGVLNRLEKSYIEKFNFAPNVILTTKIGEVLEERKTVGFHTEIYGWVYLGKHYFKLIYILYV